MKTFLFPGQGSQAPGMGADLFDEFPLLTAQADAILGYSIKQLCLDDPRAQLNDTRFTQPALFVVNALSYARRMRAGEAAPDFVAGHSLGEFNALLAAECFDFETGVKLVQKRGELMSRASGGGMAAVLNATPDFIREVLAQNGLDAVELANFNSPSQIVISGDKEQIAAAQPLLQKGRVLFFPLKTSGAFHTRFMAAAQREFADWLGTFTFAAPKIRVIANVSARPYEADAVAATLARQIASPVRWCEGIQYLMEQAGADSPMQFEEVGHGDVLTRMVKSIQEQTRNPPKLQQASAPMAVPAPVPTPPHTAVAATAVTAPGGALDAGAKVASWNARHPVGSKVRSTLVADETLETRTAAMVLFGHRAAVYLKGYNGYFDLDEIAAA